MKFRIDRPVFLFMGILLLASSCISNNKIFYLQNLAAAKNKQSEKSSNYEDTTTFTTTYKRFLYRVQVNDNLQIFVRSNSDPASRIYNKADVSSQTTTGGDISLYLNGYVVNDSGMVEIPNMGKFKVIGLTLEEIRIRIEAEAAKYIVNPFVQVNLSGINYTVLGEVQKPNNYRVYRNQLTLFEAIADAGDMKEVANRKHVRLVRQYPDGIKVHVLDLTDRNIINSPYYFIQPNDLIYVRPMKIRELGVGTTGFSTVQGVITVLSVIVLVFTLTRPR